MQQRTLHILGWIGVSLVSFLLWADLHERARSVEPHDQPFGPPNGTPLQNSGPDFGFRAIDQRTSSVPPDPHVACGPKHLVMITNHDIAFFTKDGRRTFIRPIGGTGGFLGPTRVFDPEVHWDPHAKRFVAFANERDSGINRGNSFFNVAISDDTDPNGSWHLFRFNVTALASVGQGAGDIDSPNLGIDDKAFYMSADFQFLGGPRMLIFIVDKAPMLSGKQPTVKKHILVMNNRFWGLPVVYGKAPAMYLLQHFDGVPATTIRLHAIKNALTNPTLVSTDISVPAYRPAGALRNRGQSVRIATHGSRFWSLMWRRGSLWACHHVDDPVRSRWYEIQTLGWPSSGKPRLAQSGTIDVGPGVMSAFNAITADEDGNALTVFSVGGTSRLLGIGRAWRAASDKPGTMRRARIVLDSTSSYRAFRWGDYGGVSPDPVEPNTVWYAHEIARGEWNWSTWIGKKVLAPLAVHPVEFAASQGGTATLSLDNPSHAARPYVVIGTLSGTAPGFKLGNVHVPIVPDGFTELALLVLNSPNFQGFAGTLDANGCARATFHLPPLPVLTGRTLHFAFVQHDGQGWSFASNAASLDLR